LKPHTLKELLMKEEFKDLNKITAIGIDQGYANMGYCIVTFDLNQNKYEILESGTKTTDSDLDMSKRLGFIYLFLKEILTKYPELNLVGCERLFHNKPMGKSNFFQQRNKSASIMKTNMVTGVIYLVSGEFDLRVSDFPPTTIKKQLTGSGKANKEDVEKAVYEVAMNQGIEIKTDHEADAIAIGITTINEYIEGLLNQDEKKIKRRKRKKDFIDLNAKEHPLTALNQKKAMMKLKTKEREIDLFLSQYSKEHFIRSKRHPPQKH